MEAHPIMSNSHLQTRRLVPDWVAFTALPAIWIDHDAEHIAQTIADELRNVLGLEFILIRMLYGTRTVEILSTMPTLTEQRALLRMALAPWIESINAGISLSLPTLTGFPEVHIAAQLLGYPAESGMLIAGCSRAGFPTSEDRLLLNVGANQLAILLLHQRSAQVLRADEQRFRSFSTTSPLGIFTADPAGDFTYTNARCQAVGGFGYDQALGAGWLDFVHANDRAWVQEAWTANARGGSEFYAQFRMQHPEKGLQWVVMQTIPILADGGQVLSHVGMIADVTSQVEGELEVERQVRDRTAQLQQANEALRAEMAQRTRAVESLADSEERFQLLVQNVVDYAIFMLDPNGYVISWNIGAQRLKQYRADEIVGQHFSKFYTREDIERGRPQWLLSVAEREGHVEELGWRVRKDGSRFWADVVITALRDQAGNLRGFAKVTRDMTERRHAEEQLQQSSDRLRLLAGHLQTAREDERRTIARELHDELGQILTVAKMDLSRISKRLNTANLWEPRNGLRLSADIQAVLQSIDDGLQATRRIMQRLRPQTLDELGLKAAIEAQAQQFQERSQIQCSVESAAELPNLDPDRSIALFRIFQEALTNIARHSGASQVKISLQHSDHHVLLEIADNGKGLAQSDRDKPGHFGLLGMEERAVVLGGYVEVHSGPEHGTMIRASIPLQEERWSE